MKNLVLLAGKLHPYGGIETHVYQYCRLMIERKVKLSLVITSTSFDPVAKARLIEQDVQVSEFDCATGHGTFKNYVECMRQLRSLCRSGTILYSHGTSGFAYLASKALRPALWVHHHHSDVLADSFHNMFLLYRKVLRSADWVIACTPGHASLIDNYFNRNERTICLPYCKSEPSSPHISRRHRPGSQVETVIGFFGRLRASKGVQTLISMAQWFVEQGIECRLHGDNCEGLIAGELPPGINWMGAYDSASDMDHLLATVDMVVLPTKFEEGLPIVMSEAISRGVPVVAYSSGGLREMTNFHPGVIIVDPDERALKAGIIRMRERLKSPLGEALAQEYCKRLSSNITIEWWSNLLPVSQEVERRFAHTRDKSS